MKQMFREMKINSLISLLRFIVAFGILGSVILFVQRDNLMQLFGLKPKVDEIKTQDIIICVMAGAMLLFVLWLLIWVFSGRLQKKAKEFISKLDAGEQEKLAFDYQNAWRGSRTIRIGQKYTFVLDNGARIFKNSDIIWLYAWSEAISRNGIRKDDYYFNLYLLNHEEPIILGTTLKTYSQILEYYEQHFPHIIVGDSDEVRYLYRNDRNQFLHLRYYNEQNKAE